jgi:hypothetical protein
MPSSESGTTLSSITVTTGTAGTREPTKILVTGTTGFVGRVLMPELIKRYGPEPLLAFVLPGDGSRKPGPARANPGHKGQN